MIVYFSKKVITKANKHAAECFPKESCGVVINNEYVPCNNIARDPLNDFKIDTKFYIKNSKNIEAVVHSHNNYPHASKKDMIQQITTNIPWGVVNVVEGNARRIFFWGDTLEIQELIGRPFIGGVYDCFSLLRDYYRKNKNIVIEMVPHDMGFYKRNEDLFMDNIKNAGFVLIDKKDLRKDDIIFAKIRSNVINHCGVYIGNDLILHHLSGKLSNRTPIVRWKNYIVHYLRYEGVSEC